MDLLNQKHIAVFAGSFDPLTRGHLDIIQRASNLFDTVIVAIGINPNKRYWFSLDDRLAFIHDAITPYKNVSADTYDGLLVDYCQSVSANAIVRGIRSVSDFDYESQLAAANRSLAPNIETLFLPASPQHNFLSSSAVKEIASFGHSVDQYVTPLVARSIKAYIASK